MRVRPLICPDGWGCVYWNRPPVCIAPCLFVHQVHVKMQHYFIPLKSYFSSAIQPAVWASAMGPCGWLTSLDSCTHHITSSVLVLCPDRGIRNINDVTQLLFKATFFIWSVFTEGPSSSTFLSTSFLAFVLLYFHTSQTALVSSRRT